MTISFRGKIPLAQGQVFDKSQNKFTKATLYEIDGKDKSDLEYMASLKGNWGSLKLDILTGLTTKHGKYSEIDKMAPFTRETFDKNKFYVLENEKNEGIGIAETMGFKSYSDISFIQADPDKKYKYTGQTLLGMIAKQMLKEHKDPVFAVSDPNDLAREFYKSACGFKERKDNPHALEMNKDGMEDLIKKTEEKTQSSIDSI